ncbi:unnamed protein product [Schistocephalus solidus]|uniref:UBA domain-containing protein n=1 Tax=Schistocephalus solidus TaxID=70667 RepID=A0A183SUZ2_SCHSO|nr:unnamed protein product [Schistocephalus solidus]
MGYDEDSVFDALMKANGEREEAFKILETSAAERKKNGEGVVFRCQLFSCLYGFRDRAAKRAKRLRVLVEDTRKPENLLQIAYAYLVNMGHDEDSVFDALMKANDERDKALGILGAVEKASAPPLF